jgi:hypothetical protein
MREAEEMMKEFSDNPMFSELFGGLTEMLSGSDKETGNEGSARRRAVQERLRKKMDAKKASAAGAAMGGAGGPFPLPQGVAERAVPLAATPTGVAAKGPPSAASADAQAALDAELEAAFAAPVPKKK